MFDLAWTPDGRFVLCWLPSRLMVLAAQDGGVRRHRLAGETVRAIVGGSNGDEMLVVTSTAVQVLRASTGAALRELPFDGETVVAAALAPTGSQLVLARRGQQDVDLLDLTSGRRRRLDVRASAVAWAPDGSRFGCLGGEQFHTFDARGDRLRERATGVPIPVDNAQHYLALLSDPAATQLWWTRWNLVVLDDGMGLWSTPWGTFGAVEEAAEASPFEENGQLSEHQLWAPFGQQRLIASDDTRLLLCDRQWREASAVDLGGTIARVSVSSSAGRVAVVVGDEVVVVAVAR